MPFIDSKVSVKITEEQEKEFVKAMKIGYYKTFFKQGLITAEQLEKLLAMQDKPDKKQAA